LKTLKLGGFAETLELRITQAEETTSSAYRAFLALVVQDEIERREAKKLTLRIQKAALKSRRPWSSTSPSTRKSKEAS